MYGRLYEALRDTLKRESSPDMAMRKKSLRFLWWNLESFAHYERSRAAERQWPRNPAHYRAKCDCIDRALKATFGRSPPELLAFGEVTAQAAEELRARLFPKYKVHSLDLMSNDPKLQVAFLYRPSIGFQNEGIYPVKNVPRGTRPIGYLDFLYSDNRIRFYACHWTARFEQESKGTRESTAEQLRIQIYDFVNEPVKNAERRHVVVVGDLNEEPYGVPARKLYASRSRERSRRRALHRPRCKARSFV